MAQPVYRDNLLLSKFVSALILISILFFSLVLLMIGYGIILTGVLIELEKKVLRILSFTIICVMYIGFWLGLSILLSIRFKQAATSSTHSNRNMAVHNRILSNYRQYDCKSSCSQFSRAYSN